LYYWSFENNATTTIKLVTEELFIFNVENIYRESGSRFAVTKFRQVRASRGARIGRVEWGIAFNDFIFNAEWQK
jgi:hypothetical protein